MKKSLLIAVAALFVAIGVNAQALRSPQAFKAKVPEATKVVTAKTSKMGVKKETGLVAAKKITGDNAVVSRRAAADLEGTYILDYANWDGDFTTSLAFDIVASSGTTNVIDSDDDGNEIESSFDYNLILKNFTYEGASVYAFYDETDYTILIPAQVIVPSFVNGQGKDLGRLVFSGLVTQNGAPYNFGFNVLLEVGSDGSLYNYDFAEELAAAEWPEGCAVTGFYDYLPDYNTGASYVEMGTTLDVFAANATQGDIEIHIVSGDWGEWERASYPVYVEDYGSELVVHNFFGLCPISIVVEGNTASIATPVRVMDSDYAEEGEDPNYIRINQWDSNFENIIEPGSIKGTISKLTDGRNVVEFYDTDDEGYIIKDYTNWFMVHSTWGEQGAYWWGEARGVYVIWGEPDASGISNVNTAKSNAAGKTYNLMGQQVSASAKGLVIRDGKKFVNK